jgi:hypothetical protein
MMIMIIKPDRRTYVARKNELAWRAADMVAPPDQMPGHLDSI